MKLSDWARKTGVTYITAYNWFKSGKLPVKAIQTETGTILVEESQYANHSELTDKNKTELYELVCKMKNILENENIH